MKLYAAVYGVHVYSTTEIGVLVNYGIDGVQDPNDPLSPLNDSLTCIIAPPFPLSGPSINGNIAIALRDAINRKHGLQLTQSDIIFMGGAVNLVGN